MKKLVSLLFMLSLAINAYAQKLTSGSLEDVFNQEFLNVEFDFSKAKLDGIKESSLLNIGGERAADWVRDKDEICAKFLYAFHDKIDQEIEAGHYPDAKYTLIFIPLTFDDDGEVRGDASIVNQEGNIIATITGINGDGGRFGSFTNLCGDSMERAGEDIGGFFQREHRKIRRAQKKGATK